MGSGSYSYINTRTRGAATYASVTGSSIDSFYDADYATRGVKAASFASALNQRVFTQTSLDPEMNIKGKVRESCDSEEHPTSYPIIIGLDVTGSMCDIPSQLLINSFPEIMKNVMDSGVEHAQVCFVGIGDCVYDRAPIQVGQFETSDELTEKWLKKLYLEGGGGGNFGESYSLAWYFAAMHTKIDSFEKRGVKGCLITIGDEPVLRTTSRHAIETLFGDNVQSDISSEGVLNDASEKWNIYHIDAGNNEHSWEGFPVNYIHSGRTVNDISQHIIKCILESYGSASKVAVRGTNTYDVDNKHSVSEKEDVIL